MNVKEKNNKFKVQEMFMLNEMYIWNCWLLISVDTIFINPRSDNHFFWVDKSSCPPYQNSGRDCMVVGFTTTYAISVYDYYKRVEFESRSWQCVLDTTLCDKVCQWHTTGRWVSPGTPVSCTNKTNRHDYSIMSTLFSSCCLAIIN
jgi:hypothetical protein